MLSYLRRNRSLVVGLVMIAVLLLFAGIGRLVWDTSMARRCRRRPTGRRPRNIRSAPIARAATCWR